ncbi:hypothetical protein SteCoe_16138 [Stentor coeruleus]|uniref:Uncharacterized protein n=1 Tax=Stentor coeruleus TaxID=5963 RepID=A0A1R2C1Y2_9CILI|nr:hypothetical protein SteCoe_16138 [Stentor coeruleus]
MSFQFSSENSGFSLTSDDASSISSPGNSKTLGITGAKIMNSFPMMSSKQEFKKDYETFAYLEKLKNLDITKNNIEHLHHLRHLEYGNDSFRFDDRPRLDKGPLIIKELKYKPDTISASSYMTHTNNIIPNNDLFQCQIKFRNGFSEVHGILVNYDFILTTGHMDKTNVKNGKILDYCGRELVLNKFAPLISEGDFSLVPIEKKDLKCANAYTTFKLGKMDTVFLLGVDTRFKLYVTDITAKYFVFTNIGYADFKRGSGVFSINWELQGMYSHSILNMHFVSRLEPIFTSLLGIQPQYDSIHLNYFLSPYQKYTSLYPV